MRDNEKAVKVDWAQDGAVAHRKDYPLGRSQGSTGQNLRLGVGVWKREAGGPDGCMLYLLRSQVWWGKLSRLRLLRKVEWEVSLESALGFVLFFWY